MNRVMKRMALPVGAALILGSSGFAYMASNGVERSYAGEGHGEIAGFDGNRPIGERPFARTRMSPCAARGHGNV